MKATLVRAFAALLALAGAAFAQDPEGQNSVTMFGAPAAEAQQRLAIAGSTDVGAFAPMLEAFTKRNPGLSIRYQEITTNELYDLAAKGCRGEAESPDLVISSSIDQQVKLANDGCAQPNPSAEVRALPSWAKWRNEVVGLTYEPAVVVYNRDLVPAEDVPQSRFDLIDLLRREDKRYDGKIATYDIERSGVGYLFAFTDSQQATTFGRLIEAFGRNHVVATCCSAEIIDAVASGRFMLAYNMLGSYALARAAADPRIGVVAPTDYTLVLARGALIPRNAKNPGGAKAFMNYVLSDAGRQLLAKSGLIVAFGDSGGAGATILSGALPALRPIAFSPALLVGLDRQTREVFLRLWHASLGAAEQP
jgi:ABC-type Fe3+ transport system substrate-binding protein